MRRLRAGSDDGMTLTELALVMLILGIIVAATASLSIGFMRTNAENVSRQDQIDIARSAVERMSQTIRTAVKPSQLITTCASTCGTIDAFMQGQDTSVAFYANIDNPGNSVGPSRVTYAIGTSGADAGVLTETLQTPDSPTPTDAGYLYCDATDPLATADCKSHLTVRRLADGVLSTQPIFTYYGPDGTQLSTGTTGLTSAQLNQVLAIQVVLTVQSTNVTKPQPTTYIQRITLPNAQAVLQQGKDQNP